MTTQAMIGYGSKFAMGDGGSPEVFTNLAEVTNLDPPSASFDMQDVTNMDSPDRTREFISGLNDPGQTTFDMNFVPGSDSDVALQATFGLKKNYRITYPNNVTATFAAILTSYKPTVGGVSDVLKATVTFKVSSTVTFGVAA